MPIDRDRRVYELFVAAVGSDPDERAALLTRIGSGPDGEALRREVESLLKADRVADRFLEPASWTLAAPTLDDFAQRWIGRRIGRYEIRRLIAAGGMGAVFEALQEQPQRTVALKMMRQGLASTSALRRFERETRVLARLRHPGIAQIYEAGMHEEPAGSVPWFAMEFVPGARTITAHADAEGLSTRARLELFHSLCDAVQHGHEQGIIHRDLKPANVLVDEAGRIKVIDFGVALATDAGVPFTTVQTQAGQLVGTLQYMSPEQVDADPHELDGRSDVYSLGLILYELLTGARPYDVSGVRMFEASRTIREKTPAPPSTLNRALRGDVDRIVMKTISKDRAQRYSSAAELADDVERHLTNRPVAARAPTLAYRVRTFVRRNRALTAASTAAFTVLLAALVVVSIQAFRIHRAATRLADINGFLEKLLIAADPHAVGGLRRPSGEFRPDSKWIEIVNKAVASLQLEPLSDRLAEAAIRHDVGLVYFWMAMYHEAYDNLKMAYETRLAELGPSDQATLESEIGLARATVFRCDNYEAERLALQAVDGCEKTLGDANPFTLDAMDALIFAQHHLRCSQDVFATATRMLHILEQNPKLDYPRYEPRGRLAQALSFFPGRLDEAEIAAREAIAEGEAARYPTSYFGLSYGALGRVLELRHDYTGADAQYAKSLDFYKSRSGGVISAYVQIDRARSLCRNESTLEDGLKLVDYIMSDTKSRYGADDPFTALVAWYLVEPYKVANRYEDAARLSAECIEMWKSGHHIPLPRHVMIMDDYGEFLKKLDRWNEAEKVLADALQYSTQFTEQQWQRLPMNPRASVRCNLAEVYYHQGRRNEAEECCTCVEKELAKKMDRGVATWLLDLMTEKGRASAGERVALALVEACRGDAFCPVGTLADAINHLGQVQEALGRDADAEKSYRESIELGETSHSTGKPPFEEARRRLKALLRRTGHSEAADALDRDPGVLPADATEKH